MKVSVIIPTYKRSGLICQTLDSLLEQDYPHQEFEIIVVNNNSPDDTDSVVRNYIDSRDGRANIRYAMEMRQGDCYARNSGAAIARGEYLLFCDDDSLFDSNWISCMVELLDMYQQVAMVGSRIRIKWDEMPDSWVSDYEYLLGKSSHGNKGYIISSEGFCIANGSLGVRKKVFFQVGGNNPGQIGEYLVGNAEVGLYHKIKKLGYPIAFTEDTTMWHMQTKAKNGTIQDLIRRTENCAISDAYTDVVERGIVRLRSIAKAKKGMFHSLIRMKRARLRDSYFKYRADKKYNEWVAKYQDKAFLKSIEVDDYVLGPDYKAPRVKYSTDYCDRNCLHS